MTELESKLTSMQQKLSGFYSETEFLHEGRLYDIDHRIDRFYRGVFNALLELRLILTDARDERYSFLNLIDRNMRTAVVITPAATQKKRKHTLELFADYELEQEFAKLIFCVTETDIDESMDCCVGRSGKTTVEFWDIKKLIRHTEDISAEAHKWLVGYVNEWLMDDRPVYRLAGLPGSCDHFRAGSREKELERLTKQMRSGEPVFVTGIGGIGKTQTVIQLALRAAPRKGAYLIRYEAPKDPEEDFLRETILKANFLGYTFVGQDNAAKDNEYRKRMEILHTQYAGAMLVLDNLDCPQKRLDEICSGATFNELKSMDLQLVITTRSPALDHSNVPIGPLDKEDLLTLMKDIIQTDEYPDDELIELIDYVGRHTLTVVLMAKTLRNGWWMDISPQSLLAAMKNPSLSQKELPEIATDQNQSYEYAQIYGHLRALFDISGLTESDRMVMRFATLIPKDGINEQVFQQCLSEEQISSLNLLIDRGMIQRESHLNWGKTPIVLMLHPVIRTICTEELRPTGANCNTFLQRMLRHFHPDDNIPKDAVEQIANCFSYVSDMGDPDGRWAGLAARYWDKHGDNEASLKYNKRALERIAWAKNSRDVITVYTQLANTYYKLGEPDKAMEYQQMALEKREQISADELRMAHTYNNLGNIYGSQGKYEEALHYHKIALEIAQKGESRGEITVDLAKYYTNVGSSSYALRKDEQAREHLIKALDIFEMLLPQNHPDVAQAYNIVSMVYDRMGKHAMALDYRHEALRIFEQALPEDHPELARTYNNIGSTLVKLKRYREALEYQLRGLAIREKTMTQDNPNLAVSYNNISATYRALQDHGKALEYQKKALEVRERILPHNHFQLGVCCKFIGISYHELGNEKEAMAYLNRASDILKLYLEEDPTQFYTVQRIVEEIRAEQMQSEEV